VTGLGEILAFGKKFPNLPIKQPNFWYFCEAFKNSINYYFEGQAHFE
jgi:hypothetical protein